MKLHQSKKKRMEKKKMLKVSKSITMKIILQPIMFLPVKVTTRYIKIAANRLCSFMQTIATNPTPWQKKVNGQTKNLILSQNTKGTTYCLMKN